MSKLLKTKSKDEFFAWVSALDRASADFKITLVDARMGYEMEVDEAGAILISRQFLSAPVAEPVAPATFTPDEAKAKRFASWFMAILFIAIAAWIIWEVSKPTPPLTPQQQIEADFGYSSDWLGNYQEQVAQRFLQYPESFRIREARIIPIDRDSFVHVLIFTGENAFGVRSEHSVTTVIETETGRVARVVSTQ